MIQKPPVLSQGGSNASLPETALSDFDDQGPAPVSNLTEFTVSELSFALKRMVEENFDYVRVRGEISGFKRATSGHLYMALKDDEAVLDAICWRGVADKLRVKPEDGLEVIVTGKLTTFPGRSKYQIVIQSMEAAGVGALMALLEARRVKLAAEGLFDTARKKPIPYLPKVIGVVTSPTGAVIRDILHRLNDRFPRHVLVWPALVQGEGAAAQIVAGIKGFNAIKPGGPIPRPDLIIVARGGGSLEDLWAFNEEAVVRAAAESQIPLISAVGHETDTTLIDFASDLRAPTPSAAAEMAVPVRSDLLYTLSDYNRRLDQARSRYMRLMADRLKALARALPSPADLLALASQRFDGVADRLPRALGVNLQSHRQRLLGLGRALKPAALMRELGRSRDTLKRLDQRFTIGLQRHLKNIEATFSAQVRLLESFSYAKTLERGYAVVRNAAGKLVTVAGEALPGSSVDVEFRDGHVGMVVAGGAPPKPQKAVPGDAAKQGKLL
jgi:exodeoxyribonuclease VII large subunit